MNKIIVPDHKLYMLSVDDQNEAHYVCAVLNSRHMRRILGGFLVGKQIGTTIFRYTGVRANTRNSNDLAPEEQNRLDELVLAIYR